jgi:RNA polymerase sigma-70 factor (ECF subfamily)
MAQEHTAVALQRNLDQLAGDTPAEPVVRDLLDRAARRLHQLCATLLYRNYPQLTRPPLNFDVDEMLGAVVERLLKALQEARPSNVRQFFALACQHMQWELNDLARRFDEKELAMEPVEGVALAPESSGSELRLNARRMLEAIDGLPDEEREVFSLVRIHALLQTEVADLLGVPAKAVQRRLNSSVVLLTEKLAELCPSMQSESLT